jgi:hypothetical protein
MATTHQNYGEKRAVSAHITYLSYGWNSSGVERIMFRGVVASGGWGYWWGSTMIGHGGGIC